MSFITGSYLARRAAQKERVRILYRRALKDTLNWAVHRHLFYHDADLLRERFEANKNVEDVDVIDRMITDGEASYNKWRHPDPYIGTCYFWYPAVHLFSMTPDEWIQTIKGKVPWAPGGTKFCRNPTPPAGIEIIYNFGREDND